MANEVTVNKAKGTLNSANGLETIATITAGKRALYVWGSFCNQGGAASRQLHLKIDGVFITKGDATNNVLKTGQTMFFAAHVHVASGITIQAQITAGADVDYYIFWAEAPN